MVIFHEELRTRLLDDDPAVVAGLVVVGLKARNDIGGIRVEFFHPDVFAGTEWFFGVAADERERCRAGVFGLGRGFVGRLKPPIGKKTQGEHKRGEDDQDQGSQNAGPSLRGAGGLDIGFHVQHFQNDKVLNIDQPDGAIFGVDNGQFIDTKLLHDGHRFARQGIGPDALGVFCHDAGDGLFQGVVVIGNQPAKITVGEDASDFVVAALPE